MTIVKLQDSIQEAVAAGMLGEVLAERGQTQEEAAAAMGCSQRIVSYWARGERVPLGLYARAVERYVLGE